MSDNHDERALEVLEKAVYHAQDLLEKTKNFQLFPHYICLLKIKYL